MSSKYSNSLASEILHKETLLAGGVGAGLFTMFYVQYLIAGFEVTVISMISIVIMGVFSR